MSVKRYDKSDGDGFTMVEHPLGDYVAYDDYAGLKNVANRLEQTVMWFRRNAHMIPHIGVAMEKEADEALVAFGAADGDYAKHPDRYAALLAVARQQQEAFEVAREAILKERGALEGEGLIGEQINSVLSELDSAFCAALAAGAAIGLEGAP